MRTFALSASVLALSFGIPLLASAQACGPSNGGDYTCPAPLTCRVDNGVGNCVSVATAPGQSQADATLINPLNAGTSLSGFLNNILQFVIRIGAIVVVLMLVFVGYTFVAARGAPGEITKAKDMLLWTIIGALILLGAQAISVAIQATVAALGG